MDAAAPPVPSTDLPAWTTDLAGFRSGLRGEALRAGDAGYDEARRLYNGMIDRRPALVVRCRDVADVVAAVRFAGAHALPLSVKAGGHGVAGTAVVEGGVVIDLAPMRAVLVDPDRQEASVQGGALWGDVDHATQAFGLAVPGGLISNTGVGGFTLGGGVGWANRLYGLACDNLLGAEVVTADGQVLRVDGEHHPDLLWALRGGGGNFGVVTTFRFRLHPLGPTVFGGMRLFPITEARRVLRLVRDLGLTAPPELNLAAVLTTAPDAPFIPPEHRGHPVVGVAIAYLGAMDRHEAVTRAVRELPGAIVDHTGAMPYCALQSMMDPMAPPGLQNYWKSSYVDRLPDDAIDRLLERFRGVPSPMTEVHLHYFGGVHGVESGRGSAVGNRGSPYLFNLVGRWADPGQRDATVAFVRGLWEELRPLGSGGTYVNFLADQSADVVRAAYGAANYERLVQVKRRYDPGNTFRSNHNIAPG